MRWALDPEQEELVDGLADVLDRAATPAQVRNWLTSADPSEFEQLLARDGWLAVGVRESAGGQGGGLLDLALVAEQLARHAAPSSAWTATALALPALDDQRSASAIDGGEFLAIVAGASGPLDIPSTIVESGGRLSGRVNLVLGADRASLLVVPAADHLYLVDSSGEGVSIHPRALLDPSRSAADVVLDEAPSIRLEIDSAAFLATAALRAAVIVAADSLGAATRMRELAVEYSKQRTQFGVPIGSFQAVKHAAATMLVAEEASRSLVYYAAQSVESSLDDAPLHAAAAKVQVTRAGSEAAESALTLHGAIGYTWEHDLQFFYKRAKLDFALFGEPSQWNGRLARGLQLVPGM